MTSMGMIGLAAMVIGVLGVWQRERVSQLNTTLSKRQGQQGTLMSEVGTARYFGIGATLMALAGAATAVYSLVAGDPAERTTEAWARLVMTVAAVLFVLLAIIVGVMLYGRQSKKK